MSPLSREGIWAVLVGLSALGCDKATSPVPEPEPATSVPFAAAAVPAAQAAEALATAAATAVAPGAALKEVPSAAGKPPAEKEKSCAPGGCAPGQCGANK